MVRVFLSLCLLTSSVPLFAGTDGIVASNNQISFRHLTTHVDYYEFGDGRLGTQTGILNSEQGSIRGLAMSVSAMHEPENYYYFASFDWADGFTNYTGAYMGGMYGSVLRRSVATMVDLSGRLGKGLVVGEHWMLTPYAEIGYHHWYRGVNSGEIYTHFYLGAGLLAQAEPLDRLVLSGNVLLGRTVMSTVTVNGGGGFSGFTGELGTSMLSRIGVAADYAFTPRLHGSLLVDQVRFQYGISGIHSVGGGFIAWEPDSRTRNTSVRVGVGVTF